VLDLSLAFGLTTKKKLDDNMARAGVFLLIIFGHPILGFLLAYVILVSE
jgi:hypothetical protein